MIIALSITLLTASVALAGGWHKLGNKEGNGTFNNGTTTDEVFDPNAGLWTSDSRVGGAKQDDRVPHLSLSTSSNKCRTCHAVHNADNTINGTDASGNFDPTKPKKMGGDPNVDGTGQNFKLLRNESRITECNFCHGPNGALSNPVKKPYGPMLATDGSTIAAKGQHTLGAGKTSDGGIPDSTITSGNSILTDGLSCGNCHSVHGGWTLNGITAAGILKDRLLRRDPGNNGNGADSQGAASGVINVADQGSGNKAVKGTVDGSQFTEGQYLAAFCGDCHNKNVSWDRGGAGSAGDAINDPQYSGYDNTKPIVSEGERPNKFAHPLGNVDGLIDIYGKLGKVEDSLTVNWIKGKDAIGNNITGAHVDNVLACDDCHKSRRHQSEAQADDPDPNVKNNTDATFLKQYGKSKFPHQSVGHKLMSDAYTDASTVAGFDYTGDPNRPLPELDKKVCRTCHGDVGGTFKGVGVPDSTETF